MSTYSTMNDFAQAFIELSETLPLDKISVSDIVKAADKNRKTFYYHFSGKNDLIHWIFRRDLAERLRRNYRNEYLVYEELQNEIYADLPYYIFKKQGVRSLDGSGFMRCVGECFETHRNFYAKALKSFEPDGLPSYLLSLYAPALERDIRFILSNRYLDDKSIFFLASFFANGTIGYFIERVGDPRCTDLTSEIGPFTNLVHSCLENEIKQQQLKRVL